MICPICEERRSLSANAAQWPILQAWAEQKQWSVNGSMCYLTADEWKDVLTCAFEGETTNRSICLMCVDESEVTHDIDAQVDFFLAELDHII